MKNGRDNMVAMLE
jgi:hypothetical protein